MWLKIFQSDAFQDLQPEMLGKKIYNDFSWRNRPKINWKIEGRLHIQCKELNAKIPSNKQNEHSGLSQLYMLELSSLVAHPGVLWWGMHHPVGLCLCRWCVKYQMAIGCCQCVAAPACLLGSFALCYGTWECPASLCLPSPLLLQWQWLVHGWLWKIKGEEMDRILSVSCGWASVELSSHTDQYHRNLGWTRQVFHDTGACDLILLDWSPALQGSEWMMFPREGVVVEFKHVVSCKETKSGKSCTTLGQVWCGLYGFRFRTSWLWQGVCLIPGEESSPTSLWSAGFLEFIFMGDHKFSCFWSATFSSSSAPVPIHSERYWSLTTGRKFLSTLISSGSFHLIRSSSWCLCPESTLAPGTTDSSPDSQVMGVLTFK